MNRAGIPSAIRSEPHLFGQRRGLFNRARFGLFCRGCAEKLDASCDDLGPLPLATDPKPKSEPRTS